MAGSYKIVVLLAVVLSAGIVSYHWLQPEPYHQPDPVVTTDSQTTNATNTTAVVDDPASRPGIGDLMTRIRSHMDQAHRGGGPPPSVNKTTPSQATNGPPPIATAPESTPTAGVQVSADTTPTLTFHQLPDTQDRSDGNTTPHPMPARDSSANRLDVAAATTPDEPPSAPAAPTETLASKKEPRTYEVQPGDTFSTIAVKIYGSGNQWIDIATANPFIDPKRLQVGQTIRLPNPDDILGVNDQDAPDAPGKMVTYVVRPGDSLSSIAQRYYDDAEQWRIIFDANRNTIGSDPNRLNAGGVLRIPPEHIPAR